MSQYDQELRLREGMDVVSSDGDKVGEISEVSPEYVVVQKGFFFPKTHYIPASAIASVDDRIYLNVLEEEAMNQDPPWDQPPDDTIAAGAASRPARRHAPGWLGA